MKFFAAPAFDAMCLDPYFMGGKWRKFVTRGRFKRSSWELLGDLESESLVR